MICNYLKILLGNMLKIWMVLFVSLSLQRKQTNRTIVMATQSEDFKWFVSNLKSLYGKYPNMYLVIQDKKVVASAETMELGVDKALELGLDLGTFIVQECGKDENCYTQQFFSRAIFSSSGVKSGDGLTAPIPPVVEP